MAAQPDATLAVVNAADKRLNAVDAADAAEARRQAILTTPFVAIGDAVHYVPALGDAACVPCTVLRPDNPPFIHIDMTVDETGQRILHAPCDERATLTPGVGWGYEPERLGYLGGTWHQGSRCKMGDAPA
jgi:hypothetical protein